MLNINYFGIDQDFVEMSMKVSICSLQSANFHEMFTGLCKRCNTTSPLKRYNNTTSPQSIFFKLHPII